MGARELATGVNRRMSIGSQASWPEEVPIPWDHPLVPGPISLAVRELGQPGDLLHRVPTKSGVEWWLFDFQGELIEALWLD
jgi:hypothetical protein